MNLDECIRCATQILEEDAAATKWESDFLESIIHQMESGRKPSEKQEEILERIYNERISSRRHRLP